MLPWPALLPALLLSSVGRAAPKDPFAEPDESELFRAEQELVTVATRTAQTVRQAPSIVTVVSAGDIRRAGHRTLSDVLRALPGIYVSVAKESRDLAWFRGVTSSDNNKVLLLVDGVPWYDGIYTHAWIDEYLPLEHVRQVEVIKGPGSALYGTNAFAGVVNVVTWDGRTLDGGFVRALVGSDGRQGASAVYADLLPVRGHEVEARAYVRMLGVDGDGLDVVPRGRSNVTGLDPRRALNGGLRLGVDAFQLSVDLVDYRHTYFVNEQDDALDVLLGSMDEFNLSYRNTFLSSRYDLDLGELGRLTPYLYSQRHDNPGSYAWIDDLSVEGEDATWSTTLVETQKDSVRHGLGLEAALSPAAGHATVAGVGVEAVHVLQLEDIYFEDRSHDPTVPSTFQAPPGWITDTFLFGQHTWTATWWMELTAGARLDYHSFFGPFASPRAGLLLVPADAAVVKLLYGRAFRAPNARELLVEVGRDEEGANLFTNGNPALDPELTDTIEAELTLSPGRSAELRVAAFVSGIDQQISKSSAGSATLGDEFYDNVGGTLALGAELEGSYRRGPVEAQGSYAFTQATDRATGNPVYEFPPHMAHARATWRPLDVVGASLLLDAFGPRPRRAWAAESGLEDGPAFALVHAALTTEALARGRVVADLSVRNLLDSSYATLVPQEDANAVNDDGTARYPEDLEGEGRTVMVTVEVRL